LLVLSAVAFVAAESEKSYENYKVLSTIVRHRADVEVIKLI